MEKKNEPTLSSINISEILKSEGDDIFILRPHHSSSG
jgi:hypothetical protein